MNVYRYQKKIFRKLKLKKKISRNNFIKNEFLDEFNGFKTKFLHEVKSFKDTILNTTPKNTGNQEHIITLLLDNITFLKEM